MDCINFFFFFHSRPHNSISSSFRTRPYITHFFASGPLTYQVWWCPCSYDNCTDPCALFIFTMMQRQGLHLKEWSTRKNNNNFFRKYAGMLPILLFFFFPPDVIAFDKNVFLCNTGEWKLIDTSRTIIIIEPYDVMSIYCR